MRKLVLSIIVSISSIIVLWAYIWRNEAGLIPQFFVALGALIAAFVILYFARCRSRAIIPFILTLDSLILFFSLAVLDYAPALIFFPIGALVYSTFYVYWIVKEREGLVWLKLIGFWIAVIVLFLITVNALVLYRMALAHGG